MVCQIHLKHYFLPMVSWMAESDDTNFYQIIIIKNISFLLSDLGDSVKFLVLSVLSYSGSYHLSSVNVRSALTGLPVLFVCRISSTSFQG